MSSYIINVKNTSGDEGSVITDVGFSYSDNLNEVNNAQLKISGTGETKRGLFEIGSEIKISRNGTLEFHGIINGISYLDGGGISADILGYESWLAKENGAYANSPWSATASATIFSAVLAESNYFTAGTVNAGTSVDFRAEHTDSLWNVLSNLKEATQQDIGVDYANSEIDVLDHKGSSTSVATFNDGIQIKDIVVRQSYPIGNDVRVYGKGDGTNQIKSDAAQGQDATSKSTYGIITKIIRDPKINSVSQANIVANAEVTKLKDPIKIYNFDVMNPNQSLVSGDVIILNSSTKGLSAEEVRIVSIKRGVDASREFLVLEVTNKEYAMKAKNINQKIAELEKNVRDQQTHMQGTTNILTFSEMINANNSAPLRILGQMPNSFIYDEAGNRRVNSFTLDYDVDEYRKGVGTASSNNSTTGAGITNAASTTNAGMTNVSAGLGDSGYFYGGYSDNITGDASWRSVSTSVNTGGSKYNFHSIFATLRLRAKPNGASPVLNGYVRVKNTTDSTYYPSSSGVYFANSMNQDNNTYLDANISSYLLIPNSWTNKNYVLQYKISASSTYFTYVQMGYSYMGSYAHTHSNTFNDANHTNNNSFNDANHSHTVNIGDGVSDAGSVNASQVSIYVDWYNTGTSVWDNKHSILNTGKTIDTDVDISNGDTLPDAAGYWRVRIITDSATPDLIQGIIKCKHELDT